MGLGLARQAELALPALGRVQRDDVVVAAQRRDAGADVHHHARAFVAEDGREQALRVGTRQGELVGVADAGGLDLDEHLAGLRALQVDGLDAQRGAGLPGNGCTGLHGLFSRRAATRERRR
jgi:hypothetical protein